jgi:hypothetical protein
MTNYIHTVDDSRDFLQQFHWFALHSCLVNMVNKWEGGWSLADWRKCVHIFSKGTDLLYLPLEILLCTFYMLPGNQNPRIHIKGTVSRDFLLLVFFLNQFPPSLWLYHQGRFKFFRKFAESQLKVCHRCQQRRWQMEKTFKQKNFNFVWTPWVVELTYI